MLLAVLVLLGTSRVAISAFICSAGLCAEGCVMRPAPEPEKFPLENCCGGKADKAETPKPKTGGCDCQLEASPDPIAKDARSVLPALPTLVLAVPEVLPDFTPALTGRAKPILFHSDSSPPGISRHPHLGRAPPTA
jgi:hypothetical protein